ncbi:hypothetical protein SNE40_002829 [Patella caerulea]|uniref:DNA 3'-5' helicase n=1 Tax=Patella caerulea TaxID=87958 RepID=A0AAN8K9C7_PATCE
MENKFTEAILFAKTNLGVRNIVLKDKQIETLQAVYDDKDCISILPTGYGKSLIFQLLPWFLKAKLSSPYTPIVLVVCPLNSIMQDQGTGLVKKGVQACYLNIKTSENNMGKTYEIAAGGVIADQGSDTEESETQGNEKSVFTEKEVRLKALQQGDYKIIYSHPETLVSNSTIVKLLRSTEYKKQIGCVVIDEVHMVAEW